jgi:hypothetical protein
VTRGGFVCLPELGVVPYGQSWTYNGIAAVPDLEDVAYGSNLFVAIGSLGTIYSSPDAITWTLRVPPGGPGVGNFRGIAYANGRFIAVGYLSYPVIYSDDGINWSTPTTPPGGPCEGIAYGNGVWVAVGTSRTRISSDNGVTWTTGITDSALLTATDITFGNGIFCIVTAGTSFVDGIITTTVNGTSLSNTFTVASSYFTSIAFGNQIFVALKSDGQIYTSGDAVNWTLAYSTINGAAWAGVTFGNGRFVAVALATGFNNIMYSISGTQWTQLAAATSSSFFVIKFSSVNRNISKFSQRISFSTVPAIKNSIVCVAP